MKTLNIYCALNEWMNEMNIPQSKICKRQICCLDRRVCVCIFMYVFEPLWWAIWHLIWMCYNLCNLFLCRHWCCWVCACVWVWKCLRHTDLLFESVWHKTIHFVSFRFFSFRSIDEPIPSPAIDSVLYFLFILFMIDFLFWFFFSFHFSLLNSLKLLLFGWSAASFVWVHCSSIHFISLFFGILL